MLPLETGWWETYRCGGERKGFAAMQAGYVCARPPPRREGDPFQTEGKYLVISMHGAPARTDIALLPLETGWWETYRCGGKRQGFVVPQAGYVCARPQPRREGALPPGPLQTD